MRTVVFGAGAVGGYFGARLAAAGADVTFIARGDHGQALRDHGVRIQSIDGDLHCRVATVATLDEIVPPDLILLAVKHRDTAAAADAIARVLPPDGVVVALQNGIGHLDTLVRALGNHQVQALRGRRVIAATVFIGARVTAPGIIHHTAAGTIRAGHTPHGPCPRLDPVIAFLQTHGVRIRASENMVVDLWKKLLWNAGFNGPSALTGHTVGAMISRPEQRDWIRTLVTEGAAVADAAGIGLPADIVPHVCGQTDGLDDFETSMLQDAVAGRPLESDAFYGYLVTQAERWGVDAPGLYDVQARLARMYPSGHTSPLGNP